MATTFMKEKSFKNYETNQPLLSYFLVNFNDSIY